MVKVLVIDNERGIRNTLKEMLEYEGYRVDVAQEYAQGVIMSQAVPYDAVVCDALCRYSPQVGSDMQINADVPMILISRDTSPSAAVDAIRGGAVDYISKPIDMNRLLKSIKTVVDPELRGQLFAQSQAASDQQPPRARKHGSRVEEIVGRSHSIEHVKRLIDKVGPSEARVLITGANGTGKELVARWLHEKSNRSEGPFVEVNCAAIPTELIESELFGHEKGAFTSAIKLRKGKFEQAHGGTLFMDEIGDMSLAAQAKVLRVLQEHKLSRVGSDRDIEVDVRVVAATNKDLREEIAHARFREDLYHRLSVIVIHVPSLIERVEDIPALVEHFVRQICAEYSIERKKVDQNAIEELKTLDWRGNIRELRNVVERLIILSEKDITLDDVKTYASGVV
jgi:DNA-binding NtrC family response regulator